MFARAGWRDRRTGARNTVYLEWVFAAFREVRVDQGAQSSCVLSKGCDALVPDAAQLPEAGAATIATGALAPPAPAAAVLAAAAVLPDAPLLFVPSPQAASEAHSIAASAAAPKRYRCFIKVFFIVEYLQARSTQLQGSSVDSGLPEP
jgi:hypothetical protein